MKKVTTPKKSLKKPTRLNRIPQRQRCPESPRLRFTADSWAKLVYLCHLGDTEIGSFGITPPEDQLLIHQVFVPTQQTTAVTVSFDDESVADFFEDQVAAGRSPEQFGRIWIHTHPGNCPSPSSVDEDTFARVFGGCDWAVMFILARGGKTYARLRFNTGPGGDKEIPVEVDFRQSFTGSDHPAWEEEYLDRVHEQQVLPLMSAEWDLDDLNNPFDFIDELCLFEEVELSEQGDFYDKYTQ
jgi:proteasome lid subunit RPN8/RPN11